MAANIFRAFPVNRNQPTPPPNHPKDTLASGGWEGEWAGSDFVRSECDLGGVDSAVTTP